MSEDLEALSADYPGWHFFSMWVEGNSGPGCRVLYGRRKREAILVGGLTSAAIRRKITWELGRDEQRDC